MEISDVEISMHGNGYEATLRGDVALGDCGYSVVASGYGLTEEAARANLASALAQTPLDANAGRQPCRQRCSRRSPSSKRG